MITEYLDYRGIVSVGATISRCMFCLGLSISCKIADTTLMTSLICQLQQSYQLLYDLKICYIRYGSTNVSPLTLINPSYSHTIYDISTTNPKLFLTIINDRHSQRVWVWTRIRSKTILLPGEYSLSPKRSRTLFAHCVFLPTTSESFRHIWLFEIFHLCIAQYLSRDPIGFLFPQPNCRSPNKTNTYQVH